ncbi:MAG: DUF4317 domain-containing protein [Oscillospiraceae bacterium]|nr:DUF4317 domain-containing protein [Oscillospiraceae bacterium]
MTEKEVGELRRRLRPDRTNITAVRGCYVSDSREILSRFRQSVGLMTEEDKENYLALFKRVLSGAPDKNRIEITFRTQQVADSDEHRLLMALRSSRLDDEQALEKFYEKVIGSLQMEGHYLILLAHETYDVPFKSKDGSTLDDSQESFSYVLCAICPVKPGKAALSYCAEEKEFHHRSTGWAASAPEVGFLFPAFDGRRTNLYNCLYYTRSAKDNHASLIDALFCVEAPKPAEEQRSTFGSLLGSALRDECSLEVMQNVHGELRQRIEIHKEMKSDEPLTIGKDDVRAVLQDCGVSEPHMAAFSVEYDRSFGSDALLSPRNLVGTKRMELKTPSVVVQIDAEHADLIETRRIGGVPYLLICADEGVEVNGVSIQIPED